MDCPLCGAKNSVINGRCSLCNTLLTPMERTEEPDARLRLDSMRQTIHWKQVFIAGCLVIALLVPWLVMSDLFLVPDDVYESRQAFAAVEANYVADRGFWSQKKDRLLTSLRADSEQSPDNSVYEFEGVPLEIVMAYLIENLAFDSVKLDYAMLFPNKTAPQPTLILSKYEKGAWPLRIIISLEIAFRATDHGLVTEFRRLRRGSRDLSHVLAWSYFGPELEALRKVDHFGVGFDDIRFYKGSDSAFTTNSYPLRMSWEYQNNSDTSE